MADYHDTVREELSDILLELQRASREDRPNEVILFSHSDTSYTSTDLAAEISSLGYDNHGKIEYEAYLHGIKAGNTKVGDLHVDARKGLIEVNYKPIESSERPNAPAEITFRMQVGFGGRVIGYEVKDQSGDIHGAYQKSMIIDLLRNVVSK